MSNPNNNRVYSATIWMRTARRSGREPAAVRLGIIALSLGRCKPFLRVRTCGCRVSIATGPGNLQVQSCPRCPHKRRLAVKMSPVEKGQERSSLV